MINFLFLVFISLIFVSCDALNKAKTADQSYTYELNINDCPTGSHSFSNLTDYCAALQNNTLNNNCALSERSNLFAEKCPGGFSPAKATVLIDL